MRIGFLICIMSAHVAGQQPLTLEVKQITQGPRHHFFGYIGQCLTTPWNSSGRYILTLRTDFHDRMPTPRDAADICLLDTADHYGSIPVEQTRAWNFQQGTMFYWHPRVPETQFFFNDRDPRTNRIYTVLYDLQHRRRLREFRFEDVPVANGGVSPDGKFFLAINYARMARLRPVTGYPESDDPTASDPAPANDGLFRVDIASGERRLLVSFRQLRDLLRDRHEQIEEVNFYINHSLVSRGGRHVYFFARGRYGKKAMSIDVPCSIGTDGRGLQLHAYIGGHPEWDEGDVVIGSQGGRQIRYDIQSRQVVGQLGTRSDFPVPAGDISLGPRAHWFVNGYSSSDRRQNRYVVFRRSDGATAVSPLFSRGPYTQGSLRIDPAPRWNREGTQILIPAVVADGTRQLHILEVVPQALCEG